MKSTPTLLTLLLLGALSASPGRAQTDEPTPPPPPAVEEVPVEAPESPPAPAPEARKERVRDFTAGFSAGASGSGEVVRIGGDVLVAAGEKTTLAGHRSWLRALAFQGDRLFSADYNGKILVWNTADATPRPPMTGSTTTEGITTRSAAPAITAGSIV